VQSMW